jgi:hypothetical protein
MRSDYDSRGFAIKKPRIPSPSVLYRQYGLMEDSELEAAKKHFAVFKSRMSIAGGELVIGRYSVLPYYKELEEDLNSKGAKLINSHQQHRYVADLWNYVHDLEGLTFRTWNARNMASIPDDIPLILKGETNSRKDLWKTHMYASNKKDAIEVYLNLSRDNLIGQQEIYAREYVPLVRLIDDPYSAPVTLEFRFFVAYGEVVSSGFYWSSHVDQLEKVPNPSQVPQEFIQKVIDRVKDKVNFFVMDIAKTQSGEWIVIELNDGQMSGLSENDPNVLYKNLKYLTWDRYQEKRY